jgi:hypothetical protein
VVVMLWARLRLHAPHVQRLGAAAARAMATAVARLAAADATFDATSRLNARAITDGTVVRGAEVAAAPATASGSDVVARITPWKPASDTTRQYRAVVLRNGMRLILVSDAEADKGAAAIQVTHRGKGGGEGGACD